MTLRFVPARYSLLLSCVLLLPGGVTLAQSESSDQSESSLHITGAGSTFAAPIIESWINGYQTVDDAVEISYDAVGSGAGIQQFLSKAEDIGATDAPLSAEELAAADGVRQLPQTAGMTGIKHGSITTIHNLTNTHVKIYAWYDNEFGNANRTVELARLVAQIDQG